jgi:integrase
MNRQHITQRFVDSLDAPERGFVIYGDDEILGFGVRIMQSGVVSFVLSYTVHGRERRATLGKSPELSAAAARNEALEWRRRIRLGDDPLAQKEAKQQEPLFADFAAEYMEHAAQHKRPGSLRNDRGQLQNPILPKLGKLKLSAITRRDIELLHGSMRKTPYRGNRVLAQLSSMFTYAMKHGLAESNPVHGIQRFQEQPRETCLTVEQLRSLATSLSKYPDQVAADAIRLLMLTGAREMEALSAEWSEFDLKRGTWTKPSHHTKQKKTEHLPLGAEVLDMLKDLRMRSTGRYLFPGHNGGHRKTIRKPWKQVLRASGLADGTEYLGKRGQLLTRWKTNIRIHDLRHSFASHLVSSGQSLFLVGKLLGHTQASTTQRYAHCSDASLRDSANAFPQVLSKHIQ